MAEESRSFDDEFESFASGDPEEKSPVVEEALEEEAVKEVEPEQHAGQEEQEVEHLKEPMITPEEFEAVRKENDMLKHQQATDRGRLSALDKKIAKMQTAPQEEKEEPAAWDDFKHDYPGVVEKIENEFGGKIEEVKGAVEPIATTLEEQEYKSQMAALDAAAPDWRDVAKSKEFEEWLPKQPHAVQALVKSPKAADAIFIFDTFNRTQTKPVAEDDEVNKILAKKKKQLESGKTIKSKPSVLPGDEGTFESYFEHFASK